MPDPPVQKRVVPEYEYRTAYIELFLIRLPKDLAEKLKDLAGGNPETELIIELLEQAVRARASGGGAVP